jgi:hypothetical protein
MIVYIKQFEFLNQRTSAVGKDNLVLLIYQDVILRVNFLAFLGNEESFPRIIGDSLKYALV